MARAYRLRILEALASEERRVNAGHDFEPLMTLYLTESTPVGEIEAAQSPIAGWERGVRAFASAGGSDPAPPWSDFSDPLEAIRGRFGRGRTAAPVQSRFSGAEQAALGVLGLGDDADLGAVRKAYSLLVRRYHPDRNGGDRTHEAKLRNVIDAWQTLKTAQAFA